MKKVQKKMQLRSDTVRALGDSQLGLARGGGNGNTVGGCETGAICFPSTQPSDGCPGPGTSTLTSIDPVTIVSR